MSEDWSDVSGKEGMPTWAQLELLAKEHGDGFWMLDLERFRRNLDGFVHAFVQAGWGETVAAWSLKTSWLPPVVRAAMAAGALSEVVSRHEYDLALALGADPASIIYNGPLKSRQDLDFACGLGSRVHLDGLDEVADLRSLARHHRDRNFRAGLRANVDIGQPVRGRFGIDAESGELQQAFRELAAEPNIAVNGLHLHVSAARQPEAYTRRIERLVRLAGELWPEGSGPEYLDIGGGFSGSMPESLSRQMASPPSSPHAYAAAIVLALLRRWPRGGPRLIVEPGMALAADTMQFAARVGATKTIAGLRHAIVTASVYTVKPTLHKLDMPLRVVRADGASPAGGPTVVSGWTCMEEDVLSRGCRFKLERGDWLVFDNCGAYTFVLNPRFIRGTPAVLVRGPLGRWTVSRPADTVQAWLDPFKEPE
jgi:diaminopimelate decarboxylase